jgi:hypothetical protein
MRGLFDADTGGTKSCGAKRRGTARCRLAQIALDPTVGDSWLRRLMCLYKMHIAPALTSELGLTRNLGRNVPSTGEEERHRLQKMNERSGNVYENKGPAFSNRARAGNVIENKDSYASNKDMLLKKW